MVLGMVELRQSSTDGDSGYGRVREVLGSRRN